MGKKRTKTQKQTQNRAARKLARTFARKLGVSPDGAGNDNAVVAKPKVARKTQVIKQKRRNRRQNQREDVKMEVTDVVQPPKAASGCTASGNGNRPSPLNKQMDRDFRNEHAAVQERGQAMEWKRNNGRRHGRRKTNNKKEDDNLRFAAPTFAYLDAQKSTPQLIRETTERVDAFWNGGGRVVPRRGGVSSLASVAAALEWAATPTTTPGDAKNAINTNTNPWAVLEERPDEEEEEGPSATTPFFAFAPPSFALSTTQQQTTTREDEIDPDL